LDEPVRASLAGPHAPFAGRHGDALGYPADVAPFAALPPSASAADWDDLGALAGSGAFVLLAGADVPLPPDGWELVFRGTGLQLVDDGIAAKPDDEAVRLSADDVPQMIALVERTRPGPFLPRTVELGTYLGIRRGGELIAMAGERLHPAGWTEISAVCTDDAYRGQGLATRLVHAVAHGIRARGEVAFLHAASDNTSAIRLYESLGFRLRRTVTFQGVRVPE
jgi:ribosomal protein S18 acetylase RimI-like enzyme